MHFILEENNNNSEKENFRKIDINDIGLSLENNDTYIKKFLKSFKYLIIILNFGMIYFLYFLSLEECSEGIEDCSINFTWIEKKIKEEIISSILMEIMLQLIILKFISKMNIVHIIIILNIFYAYSHGLNFSDHGYYNFFFYLILITIFTVLFIPIDLCIIYCDNKINSIRLIIIYLLLLLFSYTFLSSSGKNCDEWSKGLNNTFIDNDKLKYGCQIQIPKLCLYKSFEFIQDFTKLIGKNCKTYKSGKEQKENIIKLSKSPYINDNTNRIGYPLLNKSPKSLLDFPDYRNTLNKYFLKNLVDMDNEIILNKYFKENKPEIEVDFTKNNETKLVINLHYNETLSKERQLLEKSSEPYSKNILILYLDSVSRVNALRQLKKTIKFFEKFMPYKGGFHQKYPSENFHSFQFFKYHSFKGHTTINYPFLFYGQNRTNLNKTFITKYLKENGFITSEAIDWCGIDNIRTFHNFTQEDIFDHIFSLCDPNNDYFNLNTIRCLYGKQNAEHLIEYTEQFWKKYVNNRKYSIIITNYAHEGTLTVIKYLDSILTNFLDNLFNQNLLKDTIVFLLSDHGTGMPSIYYSTDFYKIEGNLPILLIMINDRKNITYEQQYKYIYENQQNFITPFDIYNTLGNIIYGNKYKNIDDNSKNSNNFKSHYGTSLFEKMYSKKRYPKKYRYLGLKGIARYACK